MVDVAGASIAALTVRFVNLSLTSQPSYTCPLDVGAPDPARVRKGARPYRQGHGEDRRRSHTRLRDRSGPLHYMGICPILPPEAMKNDRKSNFRLIPCNATALRQASRRLTQLYDAALEPCGLRSTQFAILAELAHWSTEPPTLAELADALAIDRSALGHNLRPLEREAFIVLREGVVDRRQRRIALTSKGKAKYREGLRLWRVPQDRFEQVFGRSEATALRATLLGIAHHERLASLKA